MRALLLLAALAAPAGAQPPSARRLMSARGCMSCHRIGAIGGDSGPDLTLVGFRRGAAWLERWLEEPKGWKQDTGMPNFRLGERERTAIVEYLTTLNEKNAIWDAAPWRKEGSADPILHGAVIYIRAGCVACHGPRGSGGHPNNNVPGERIPSLENVAETYTEGELIDKIARGSRPERADPEGPQPLVSMPAWGKALSRPEIRAVAAYLLSLRAERSEAEW